MKLNELTTYCRALSCNTSYTAHGTMLVKLLKTISFPYCLKVYLIFYALLPEISQQWVLCGIGSTQQLVWANIWAPNQRGYYLNGVKQRGT